MFQLTFEILVVYIGGVLSLLKTIYDICQGIFARTHGEPKHNKHQPASNPTHKLISKAFPQDYEAVARQISKDFRSLAQIQTSSRLSEARVRAQLYKMKTQGMLHDTQDGLYLGSSLLRTRFSTPA